jgi:hypothetical protein
MKLENDGIVFSDGRTEYANCGIIGISPEGGISGGYDQGIDDIAWSDADRREQDR